MSTETSSSSLIERILAFTSLSIIAIALLSFFVTLIVGLNDREVVATGFGPIVYGISIIGLPVGFLLLIVLLIVSQVRRRREFRRNQQR